ncbi:MAG: NAD(P)-dependent oxidoreductase [Flavobacteriales bacterium CG_4_10_14_0_2_um_filter_32_8]|nr:MAG: NAD(P)-dependent oxidoreductase [Flavobacteriales bacterium CG_4_10_14_0_2_um_filter_32_8]
MKKAIVFGANGYLGRHIAYYLTQQKINFIPTDLAEQSIDNYLNYTSIDITKPEEMHQINYEVDCVFMFAGLTGSTNTPEMEKKYTKVNEQGLMNVLNCCKGIKNLRLIFPSTRLVYQGIKNTPLKENSAKETKTIYAKNKLACEKILADYQLQYHINYTIFRIGVPYGNLINEEYSYGTIGFFINQAKKNNNITLYGDGSLKRTFTHVSDICEVIIKSVGIEKTINNIYNIGSNDDLSLFEVASLIASKYNASVELIDWTKEALAVESGDTIFDDEKIQAAFNYPYQYSLKEWVEKTL